MGVTRQLLGLSSHFVASRWRHTDQVQLEHGSREGCAALGRGSSPSHGAIVLLQSIKTRVSSPESCFCLSVAFAFLKLA